ncbi:MAG: hypothetical protein QW117_00880 [Candidatus Pacearchaeota archaeon]
MAQKIKFIKIKLPLLNEEVFIINRERFNNVSLKLDITRKLKGKGCEIIFKIDSVKDGLKIDPKRIRIYGFFIRRLIRKGTDYVEDSFDAKCKNADLRVKPLLITRRKVHKNVKKSLRKKVKEEIINYFKDKNYEEIFSDLLKDNFQKNLSKRLRKIYPLSFCDIRDVYVK